MGEYLAKAHDVFDMLYRWCMDARAKRIDPPVGMKFVEFENHAVSDGEYWIKNLEHAIRFDHVLLAARRLVFTSRNEKPEKIRMNLWIDFMENAYKTVMTGYYREHGVIDCWKEYK